MPMGATDPGILKKRVSQYYQVEAPLEANVELNVRTNMQFPGVIGTSRENLRIG